jgi:uncharacterized protein YfeS
MEAYVLMQSYDRYGGGSLSIVGDLLEHAAREHDVGVDSFEATACFRTERPAKPTLEDLHARFHAELAKLPRIRWERKRRRLYVRYGSGVGLAEDVFERPASVALLQSAVKELSAVLHANADRLSRRQDLNIGAVIELLDSLVEFMPETDEELVAFATGHAHLREAERAALPWWEQLGINWADYHPAARELLNDPFFWSEIDGHAPHGNDTGADLMSDFRSWRQAHKVRPPIEFLERVLGGWGVSTDWKLLPLAEWDSNVELAMCTHAEAAVALAFALIKLEGSCDDSVRAVALEALDRLADPRLADRFGWRASRERAAASERMKAVLERARGEEK